MIKGQMSFGLKHSKHAEQQPLCTPTAIYTTVQWLTFKYGQQL